MARKAKQEEGPPPTPEQRRARRRRLVIEYIVIAVAAVLIAVLIQAFVVKPYRIPSGSMETTLMPGDRVFTNRFIYHFTDIDRGEIVVFNEPGTGEVLIKRVIGLPGETISLRDGRVSIDDRPIKEPWVRRIAGQPVPTEPFDNGRPWSLAEPYRIPAGSYFMMGDNRIDSGDSRAFGPVQRDLVIGEAFFIYWPLSRMHFL